MASSFAREVDFFSIGTNDLTQYVLAVDRGNDSVASLYSSAHPAVLRMVKDVASAARHHGIDCSLCGGRFRPLLTMLLLGLGLRTLSLTPSRIPDIRRSCPERSDGGLRAGRPKGSPSRIGPAGASLPAGGTWTGSS